MNEDDEMMQPFEEEDDGSEVLEGIRYRAVFIRPSLIEHSSSSGGGYPIGLMLLDD